MCMCAATVHVSFRQHFAPSCVCIWDDSSDDEGDQVEESLPLSWDTDEDVPKED